MSDIKKVKAAGIFPLISEIVESGQSTRIAVTGTSMVPFLRDGMDSVEFTKGSFEQLHRGDIVLIKRTSGDYVMHRVLKKAKDCFYIVGDAQQWIEGPLYSNQIIAVASAVWRKNKRIPCSWISLKLLSHLWLLLLPFRIRILRGFKKVGQIMRKA